MDNVAVGLGPILIGLIVLAFVVAIAISSDAKRRQARRLSLEPAKQSGKSGAGPAATSKDAIEPTTDRVSRLQPRFSRSTAGIGAGLRSLFGGTTDEAAWQELHDALVMADLGVAAADRVVRALKDAAKGEFDAEQLRGVAQRELTSIVDAGFDRSLHSAAHDGHPAVFLMVGVNGTGKTTTTGKLGRLLAAEGKRTLMGAADTFRAAAADQLETWAQRVGAHCVRGAEGADPAAVAFEAVQRGIADGVDVVLLDTAGRLHTKAGLMDELGKVHRVVSKTAVPDEVLLVIDATTGQNGLNQARVFAEVVPVTGVVLTKLDGTAKGGIVVAVQQELGVPVKLVGLGEGPDDLAPFEPAAFVAGLLDNA